MPRTWIGIIVHSTVRLTVCAAVFFTAAEQTGMLSAQERGRVPRVRRIALRIAHSDDSVSPEESLQQQEALGQYAFRDRQLRMWLSAADRFQKNGQTELALTQLQRILAHYEDAFIHDPNKSSLLEPSKAKISSARALVMQRFEGFGPEIWKVYEILYGGTAQAQLQEAQKNSDIEAVSRVSRHYFHTAAGFEATNWLASWWTDHARYESAARCWGRLLSVNVHRPKITPIHRLKAATVYRRCGLLDRANAVLADANVLPTVVGGEMRESGNWLTQVGFRHHSAKSRQDWRMVMGAPSRVAGGEGSFPYIRPLWTHALNKSAESSVGGQRFVRTIEAWAKKRKRGLPTGVAHFPLVVKGQVIFRDPLGIRALDSSTGEPQWNYDCKSSLYTLMQQRVSGNKRQPLPLDWALAGNATWGMLSSDGHRVFAIDHLEMSWDRMRIIGGRVSPGADHSQERRKYNRLIALNLDSQGKMESPAWSVGGPSTPGAKQPLLAGYFFLGPPLPLDGRLFVVAESEHRQKLIALDAATGKLLWSQGIAFVDHPIERDQKRYTLACTPSYANGVLVCPTQLGVLVGVDETTGSLLWIYYYGDPAPKQQFGHSPYRPHTTYGHVGYPDLPLIASNCVITMPRQSGFIHCLDLSTGKRRWRIPRDDGEFVATIHGETVMVVGRHNSRGLSLNDGGQLWTARPGMCSGRGIQVDDKYLLPLASGVVCSLDITTGRKIGFTKTAVETPIGNLAIQNDVIYSMAGTQLTAFPQAGPLLKKLELQLLSKSESAAAEDILLAGELNLALGNLGEAKQSLRTALDGELPTTRISEAESLLREAIYLQLKSPSSEEADLLAELGDLVRTPSERGRHLILKAEFEFRRGRFNAAVEAALGFSELQLSRSIPLTSNGAHWVTKASWVPSFLARVRDVADPEAVGRLFARIDQQLDAALTSGRPEDLRRFLESFSFAPQAELARLALAELVADRGRYQAAEFLLLKCRECSDEQIAGAATLGLARLYHVRHVYADCVRMLDELNQRYRDLEVADGVTGGEAVADILARDRGLETHLTSHGKQIPITRVSLSEERWPQFDLEKIYSNFWRPLKVPFRCNYDLRPTGKRRPSTDLWQVDRQLGISVGVLRLPEGAVPPLAGTARRSFAGHFFSVGSNIGGAMYGVSLLDPAKFKKSATTDPPEKNVSWTTVAAGTAPEGEEILPGPAGTTFCAFQTSQQLLVLNPANGRVLWQRSDIQPGGGLFADRHLGLFGDEEVLVLFGRDNKSFTVYETTTGRELRQGRLDIDLSKHRRIFGRNYLHVSKTAGQYQLRLWDPLTDEFLCDELLVSKDAAARRNPLIVPVQFSQSFAFLSKETGGIRFIDGQTGNIELDVPLSAQEAVDLKHISVFSDDERFYVNFQRHVHGIWRTNSFAGETYLPSVRVNGELRAYSRSTGNQEWLRKIPQCVVLRFPDFPESVLVTLSRISWRGRYFLQVAAYHAGTGKLLGVRRDILSHRIVHAYYDRATRELELRSLKSKIKLRLLNRPVLDGEGGMAGVSLKNSIGAIYAAAKMKKASAAD